MDKPIPQSTPAPGGIVAGDDVHQQVGVFVSGGTFTAPTTLTQVSVTAGGTYVQPAPAAPRIERNPTKPRAPRPLAAFRNRQRAILDMHGELRPDGVAWLRGAHGSGRSTLLRQLGNQPAAAAMPDGVLLLDGRFQVRHPDDLLQRLFERFFTSDTTVRVTPDTARAWLGQVTALLLLDSLPFSADELVRLSDDLRPSAVIITANSPAPAVLPDVLLGPMPRADAVALLEDYDHESDSSKNINRLCAALDDLPLPIILAARLISQQHINSGRLATTLQRNAHLPPLTRIITEILYYLDPEAQQVLAAIARIGGTVGDSTLLAATSQLPLTQVTPLLNDCIQLGLVSGSNDRYSAATPGIRSTLDQLLPPGDERERAARYLLGALATRRDNAAWLQYQRDNLLAAAETLHRTGNPAGAAQLAQAIHGTVVAQGHFGTWGELVALVGDSATQSGDSHLQAWALHEQGTRAGLLGNLDAALRDLDAARDLRARHGDAQGAHLSQANLAYFAALVPPPPPVAAAPVPPPVPPTAEPAAEPAAASGGRGGIFAAGVLLVLLLVLIGAAGWWLFSVARGDETNGTPTPTALPVAVATGAPATAEPPPVSPTPAPPTATPAPPTATPAPPTPTPTVQDTTPPPPPEPLFGGSTPNEPEIVACGEPVILRWQAVDDPAGVARYVWQQRGAREVSDATSDTSVDISPVRCDEDYSWVVRAEDGAGNRGEFSPPRYFRVLPLAVTPSPTVPPAGTDDNEAPAAPVALEPQDNSTLNCSGDTIEVEMRWQAVSDASEPVLYELQLEDERGALVLNEFVADTTLRETVTCDRRYIWRVRAIDAADNASPFTNSTFRARIAPF